MAKPRKRKYNKRNKGKIKIRKSVRLVHKNDATRVDKSNVDSLPRIQGRPPADVAPTFRIKIKKK